jgi:hypothetical protein
MLSNLEVAYFSNNTDTKNDIKPIVKTLCRTFYRFMETGLEDNAFEEVINQMFNTMN